MKNIIKYGVLFVIFGTLYYFIEILWRGHSHWTMWLLGGFLASCVIGNINETLTEDMSLLYQGFISALGVTLAEFIVGLIINALLGWNVWDYSNMPFNLYGQICLLYSCLWLLLSIPCVILDDYLRHKLFGEKMPKYRVI